MFSQDAWARNESLYTAIITMPFNVELGAGTLSQERFAHYIIQDAHYLEGFARALSLLSARGAHADHVVQFAEAAQTAIIVERSLHSDYFRQFGITEADVANAEPTPACEHYVSYLLRMTALASFETGLAAILPCFWIYREVGAHIHTHATQPNPYQAWIDTYAGEAFDQAVDAVIAATDAVAGDASEQTRASMHHAFTRATQLEWIFWNSAYQLERWPV
jgi:thiaminase/transcriptional activator TenA